MGADRCFEEVSLEAAGLGGLPEGARLRLGATPLAHEDVWAARYLPERGLVVSLSRSSLRVWDQGRGVLVRVFRPSPMRELPWRTLAYFDRAGGLLWLDGGVVRRWHFDDGRVEVCLEGLDDHHGISLGPDGDLLLATGGWVPAGIYSLSEGRLLYRLPEDRSFSVSPDGSRLAVIHDVSCQSGSDLLEFVVLDARTGETVCDGDSTTCHDEHMYWSRDGRRLLYGDWGELSCRAWTVGRGWGGRNELIGGGGGPPVGHVRSMAPLRRALGVADGDTNGIEALAFDATGRWLATPWWAWDGRTGRTIALDPTRYSANAVAIRRARLFRVIAAGAAAVFDLATGEPLPAAPGALPGIEAHAYSPDVRRVAYVDTVKARGGVRLARVPRRRGAATWARLGQTEEVARRKVSLAWSADGSTIAAGTAAGSVLTWDAGTGALTGEIELGDGVGLLDVLAITADGRGVAAASWTLFAVAAEGEVVHREETDRHHRVRSVAFWPGGVGLAIGRQNGPVELRIDERPARTLWGHGGAVTALAFSPDGRTLASGGADGTVVLWDLA